jgi:hypothetical protein
MQRQVEEPARPEEVGNPSDEEEDEPLLIPPDDGDDDDDDEEEDDDDENDQESAAGADAAAAAAAAAEDEEAIGLLTRRLRCLFNVITFPIVPLGSLVTLSLVWMLYAAFWVELGQPCSHSLHGYAGVSLALILYIPNHAKVRSRLFDYRRERDGYQRPASVRRYDQCFHTLALLYVYGGVTLVQTCREDVGQDPHDGASAGANAASAAAAVISTCASSCPSTYRALWVYVSVVELFTFSLILPLLFLPCLYLWYLRQATADAEALAMLQERLQEEDFLFRNGGITADEVLGQLERVKFVGVAETEDDGTGGSAAASAAAPSRTFVVPWSSRDLAQAKDASGTKSCCICMSDFDVQVVEASPEDVEAGQVHIPSPESGGDEEEGAVQWEMDGADNDIIVRTKSCGHLFHRHCIGSWVGGRWQSSDHENSESASPRRRARRTTCPLCRSDLRPST